MMWSIEVPEGFQLKPIVLSHGWHQCRPFEWHPDTGRLVRVLRTNHGIRAIELHQLAGGSLEVTVPDSSSTPDAGEKSAIDSAVARMLAFDIDLSGFHALCANHPELVAVPRIGAGRLLRCPSVWEDMVKAICGTNIQWKQAVTLINRVAKLGDPAEEEGHRAWPTPEQVAGAGPEWLREECRLGYRSPYVAELAARLVSGDLDTGPIERNELDGPETRKFFLSVKGIGKATANLLAILYGHYDQLSIDSATYNFVGGKYFDGEKPTDDQITALYEPFGEWAALAYWYDAMLSWWWPSIEADLA